MLWTRSLPIRDEKAKRDRFPTHYTDGWTFPFVRSVPPRKSSDIENILSILSWSWDWERVGPEGSNLAIDEMHIVAFRCTMITMGRSLTLSCRGS